MPSNADLNRLNNLLSQQMSNRQLQALSNPYIGLDFGLGAYATAQAVSSIPDVSPPEKAVSKLLLLEDPE